MKKTKDTELVQATEVEPRNHCSFCEKKIEIGDTYFTRPLAESPRFLIVG